MPKAPIIVIVAGLRVHAQPKATAVVIPVGGNLR